VSEAATLLVAALGTAAGALKAKALAGLARCSLMESPPNVASARELAASAAEVRSCAGCVYVMLAQLLMHICAGSARIAGR